MSRTLFTVSLEFFAVLKAFNYFAVIRNILYGNSLEIRGATYNSAVFTYKIRTQKLINKYRITENPEKKNNLIKSPQSEFIFQTFRSFFSRRKCSNYFREKKILNGLQWIFKKVRFFISIVENRVFQLVVCRIAFNLVTLLLLSHTEQKKNRIYGISRPARFLRIA